MTQSRELEVVREIAHAFLTSSTALEVHRRALARLTPLVGASFSSVFLRDSGEPELLKLECAQNWPQSSARFLAQLRIRVGRGPTGRAVAERRPVEVPDIFADTGLREWWEPARELGFASLISLPLSSGADAVGAVTFYFDAPHDFDEAERALLDMVAWQLGATAGRARLVDDLRRANAQLARQNDELAGRVREAEEARRLKEEFLSNVSHELRTPLNSILGYTYLLSNGEIGSVNDSQANAIAKIDLAGNVLLHLITDLLELSRVKLGKARAEPRPEDAVALAQRAAEVAGSPHEAVTFRLSPAVAHMPVTTDGEKVVMILANLLSNAFKFTTAGEVVLSTGREADEVWWRIRDTGIGIDPENLDAIFDEFRQVDGSSTRLYGGTGLGLALSKRLAELVGGRIEVESALGAGSTFTLTVPRSPTSP